MSLRDLVDNLKVVNPIVPQVVSTTGTVLTGVTGVDTRDYDSAMVVFNSGAIVGSGLYTPSVYESDDDSTYTAVAAADLQGTALTNLTASAVQKIGYIGSKRYIKPALTYVSGTSVAASASVVLSRAHRAPVS
jgi:hypothetical protein